MDISEWIGEQEREISCHLEDWFKSRDGKEDRTMASKPKTYKVTVSPPGSESETFTVVSRDGTVLTAKAEASKLYYNHVFTGQFKYMRAKAVKQEDIEKWQR